MVLRVGEYLASLCVCCPLFLIVLLHPVAYSAIILRTTCKGTLNRVVFAPCGKGASISELSADFL